jgi:pantoate--beta-alanine ligase
MSETLNTISAYQNWYKKINQPVVTVFTMGALHSGHAKLIEVAKEYVAQNLNGQGKVVVSIFVNPTQFNSPADLSNYPRTLDADLVICAAAGADVVFTPTASEMYPAGESKIGLTHYQIGNDLEGASRPGHFEGMLTVVTKLLNITKPIATFFGEKDFQQLVLVKQLVSDLNMEINVIGVPTVRDQDGFALSSRNKRLSETQRELASQIPATLTLLKHSISEGHDLTSAINIATEYLTNFPEIKIDYLELRNQQLGKPSNTDSVRALIAVQIGEIRLIDNMTVRD